MNVRARLGRQTLAGGLFVAIGAGAFMYARHYSLGTMTRMGPGYFPSALAIALMLLGLISIVQSLWRPDPSQLPGMRIVPLLAVTFGIIGFGLLIDRLGLLIAVAVLVTSACYARLRHRPFEVALLAAGLAAVTGWLFTRVLVLPLRLY